MQKFKELLKEENEDIKNELQEVNKKISEARFVFNQSISQKNYNNASGGAQSLSRLYQKLSEIYIGKAKESKRVNG
jgi:uncharacterized coiled-coil DUF342 family protein